ncbi:MAG: S-methyl-5-thioribose-1-phosphate isomerase [Solirubrobacteraceae bacterium]|nr:S-methyl-5-thioribose-1-phosphate isomerase [Solirubrobacteraceae bacterium]
MSHAPTSTGRQVAALRWDGERLQLLDQTLLPAEERWLTLTGAQDTADAIARLAVRGAPNIGIAAAYGLAMAVTTDPSPGATREAAAILSGARPTAINLSRAVDRVHSAAAGAIGELGERAAPAAARAEAEALHGEEYLAAGEIARHGADLLRGRRRILTHCNTGALAAAGAGTALGVIAELASRDPEVRVLACETRPLLQGARLTAWELQRADIGFELVVDGAAAGLIRAGEVDAVIVGADRIAANGDTANKVGTYAHALAAAAAQIPFVVAAPTSTIDLSTSDGTTIPVEERGADEVTGIGGGMIAPVGVAVRNPAFDVTPAALIGAVVTEKGVARAPYAESLADLG